jgi:hypothetical protein
MTRSARLALLLVIVVALFGVMTAQANDSIAYGDVVEGTLSGSDEVVYTFDGQKGDVVVVQVVSAPQNGTYNPEVKILDARDREVVNSAALIIFGRIGAMIGGELAADGEYRVVVSGSEGDFIMALTKPEVLEPGDEISDQTTSTPERSTILHKNMYLVDSADDFTLTYKVTDGGFTPTLAVHAFEAGGNLFPIVYVGGSDFISGAVTVAGSRDFRIVTVGSLNFGSRGSGDEQRARFTLTLELAD